MLKIDVIGFIGADAKVERTDGGKEFGTFRVAHSGSYKDDKGTVHESTIWVDITCLPTDKVFQYLKKGTQVFVRGNGAFRVFSSAVDKCHKCGVSIRATEIQLLSSKKEEKKEEVKNEYKGF